MIHFFPSISTPLENPAYLIHLHVHGFAHGMFQLPPFAFLASTLAFLEFIKHATVRFSILKYKSGDVITLLKTSQCFSRGKSQVLVMDFI